jgi:hypothetical protein
VQVVFYNIKLPWFVSELPEKDISNVKRGGSLGFIIRSVRGSALVAFYNKLSGLSELNEKDFETLHDSVRGKKPI